MAGKNAFSIDAKTCTFEDLRRSRRNGFVVPIFQRPYSWGEDEIYRFINDIFIGFWGSDRKSRPEPFFAGTIQLSNHNEIIDGQQRLSTLLVLQKVLGLRFFDGDKGEVQKFIETKVNNGTQDKQLSEFLKVKTYRTLTSKAEKQSEEDTDSESCNAYIRNAGYVDSAINKTIGDLGNDFDCSELCEYIQKQIIFVVIETKASLSKTLQIFDTINTSGMDLNTEDLFKIRMYEYLKTKKNFGEDAFEKISSVYAIVDENNQKTGMDLSMDFVLSIYQPYLIAKYNLPNALFGLSCETFFERLFDALLGTKKDEEGFSTLSDSFELSLDDLRKIIEVSVFWHKTEYISTDEMIAHHLLEWSRYSRHNRIVYLLFLSFWRSRQPNETHKAIAPILIALSKLFFIYSMNYDRAVYEIHSFVYEMYGEICSENSTPDSILEKIQQKIKEFSENGELYESFISEKLGGQIYYSATKRNLMGLLAAYFTERKGGGLEGKLFDTAFDIEHIHATADDTKEVSDDLQNCIGNLMLLECSINRSIGKKKFTEKKEQYRNSSYKFAKELAETTQYKWSEKDIVARRDEIVAQATKFLFQ